MMKGRKALFGFSAAMSLLAADLKGAEFTVEVLPQYNQLFQPGRGWIGGDGAYSVALSSQLTLWLFSDTWIGEVRDGKRVNATLINNSAAWQHGHDPARAKVEFFHGTSPAGKPAALIAPADGVGWFWPFDGVLTQQGLFLFLMQIEKTADHSAFGFKEIGAWLGEVSNPLAAPTQWRVKQKKIPWTRFSPQGNRLFGSAVLQDRGFIYIYGATAKPGATKSMILARAPEGKLADFTQWRFFSNGGWKEDVEQATALCPNIANEYSVSWQPALKQYVAVFTENGISKKIVARLAPAPSGPWGDPIALYQCPEADWDKTIFCYAAKGHPMLAQSADELVVTYVANATDFWQVLRDARLYWPRFLRVRFASERAL